MSCYQYTIIGEINLYSDIQYIRRRHWKEIT